MKKSVVKIFSTLFIFCSLFSVNAYAGTWIKHQGDSPYTNGVYLGGWEYQNDDGTPAVGWKYINNNWYYFDSIDGCAYTGLKTINGKDYSFDPINCDMKHDQYVKVSGGNMGVYYWANSDGSIDYNKLKPYND
ncbi:hypothetical protein [Clostridium saccharoperbutylacetonicum]|uniref:hypothetical protein n=1 Tax=Clostridium saccharoperbutylacetonicum TaxID=36745 RepID=UPI000983AA78|nr:hypothetical protein [Clostridium saccharoperbutylacetonicum]AQR95594.1 hypothetical protein CLSAP_29100 [Clostridium saccharoperbutylacetonicum]NSB31455.1 glucan-binding YG repeat protein [Clostridium saccharoperbutylacetonicum]